LRLSSAFTSAAKEPRKGAQVAEVISHRVVTHAVDRPARPFQAPKRIQTNMVAYRERQLLNALCRFMPGWVTSDHLTILGVMGAVIAAIGYAGVNRHPAFYLLASFGLVVNWFGDSLDGSLARFRKVERPRYGYFVDHSTDVISNFFIIGGLGLSPHIGMAPALFALCGYLSLSIYVFLLNQVSGQFQLTFMNCGPTEIRLGIIAFNMSLLVIGPTYLSLDGYSIPLAPTGVALLGGALGVLFVINLCRTARTLADQSDTEKRAADKIAWRGLESISTGPGSFGSDAEGSGFATAPSR
jgi:archaetidylinositol phosphate synthase